MVLNLSGLWWIKIRDLWKLPDGWDSLREKLVLVWMSRAMLSKSLIQFCLWAGLCSLPIIWPEAKLLEIMKIMGTSFKMSHAGTATLSAPNLTTGHCWHMPPPETPGPSQASLGQSLVGSLLLSLGSWCTQGFVCALQESVSPVLCKFWWLYGGVNGDLLQEHYTIPQSNASRAPASAAVHCWSIPLQETLKHSSAWVFGSWCTQGMFEPSKHLWQVWGLILNRISPLLPSFWGFSFALGCGVSPQSRSSTTQLPLQHWPTDVRWLQHITVSQNHAIQLTRQESHD